MTDAAETTDPAYIPEPESPAFQRFKALLVDVGLDPAATEPPDPEAVVAAFRGRLPDLAVLLVFAVDQDDLFKLGPLTDVHVEGFGVFFREFGEALADLAACRAEGAAK